MSRYRVSMAVIGHPEVTISVDVTAELRATAVANTVAHLSRLLVPGTKLELENIKELA